MAEIISDKLSRSVFGTGINGEDVRLAALRKEFEKADYAPATCPPRLVELQDVGCRNAKRPQTIACFYELGESAGQSRIVKIPVMDKAPDIVNALKEAGFNAPPVKTPLSTYVRRIIGSALSLGRQ